jgi:hypothetical protein
MLPPAGAGRALAGGPGRPVIGRTGQPSADLAVRDPADDRILPPAPELLRFQVTDEAVPAILCRPTGEPGPP